MRNNSPKRTNPCGLLTSVTGRNYWKVLLLGAALAGYTAHAATPTLTGVDVGSPSYPGSTTVGADGKITVEGGGSDIWNSSDNFHYAYFKVTGDFDYVVKVESLTGNTGDGGWSKAELMARFEDPASPGVGPQGGDPHISNMTTRPSSDTPPADDSGTTPAAGVNNRGPQWRATRDGASSWTAPNPAYPPNMPDNWMRLERVGSVFYMYTSNDGKSWNMYNPYSPQGWDTKGSWPPGTDNPDVAYFTEAWPDTIFLGLAVTAHADGYTSKAVFSNFGPYTPTPVAISQQPPATVNIAANSKLEVKVAAAGDPVHYEWRKNGTPVSTNGLDATYTIALPKESDSGTYTVRVYGSGKEVISDPVAVTVTADTSPPSITEAKPLSSQTSLKVTFSEPVTSATATVANNYEISGGVTASSAVLSDDAFSVTLVTSQQALNTQYTLKVKNVKDTGGNTVAADNQTVFTSVSLLKGYAVYERWDDASGDMGDLTAFSTALDDGSARAPDVTSIVNQFGAPWGVADNYNARVRTYFTAPSSGNYVFFVSSDDSSNVYLSSDENPANKKLICQENGWSNQYQWTAPGSGSADDKRSDYNANTEWGNTITLTGGKTYYMEARLNEGGGGDGVDVTFIKQGEADPSNDVNSMKMKGDAISWYESVDVLPPVIVTEPVAALTIPKGGSGTISVVATNPGAASLTYQWKLNGKAIPGATSASYAINNASAAHIGQYWVTISNPKASVTTGQGDTPTVVLVTDPQPFNIEAEDFNYDGGKTKAEASTMPYKGNAYEGLGAVPDVDYHNTGTTTSADGWTPIYRTGDPITSGTEAEMGGNDDGQWGKTRAGAWDMTQNYKIGWIGSGDWGNYTRTFPAGTFEVFAAQSFDGVSASQLNGSIGFVTSGATTTTQTVQPIGQFDAPGTGAWSRNNLVRMTDSSGAPKTVTFTGGEQTIRWTYNSGDADYLLFIPVSGGGQGFTSISVSDGNLHLEWSSGSLNSADLVTGPWAPENKTSPASIPMTEKQKFYLLK